MKDTVIQLQSVAKTLSSLAVTLFDADPYTLQYIISYDPYRHTHMIHTYTWVIHTH